MKKILVLDQTLRDGEQQALINFSQEMKLKLAESIRAIGVDYIDIMPISNDVEKKTTLELLKYPLLISTPLNEKSIKLALELKKNIVLFQAVSDPLLTLRYKKDATEAREENIKQFKKNVIKIRKRMSKDTKIFVAGEDTSRANNTYLIRFIKSIEDYIDGFFIADSIGYLIPEKTKELVQLLRKNTQIRIGIHTHNDLGFADLNTVEAVLAGANIISGTFTGIGERAGNANLGNVIRMLKNQHNVILNQIDYKKISSVEKLVHKFAKRGPAKPFSKEAFYVESGIHVHALLKSPMMYSLMDPKLLGFKHKIFFSKKSGISNFKWYFKDKYKNAKYKIWRNKIKELSIQKNRSFTLKEIKKIFKIKNLSSDQ